MDRNSRRFLLGVIPFCVLCLSFYWGSASYAQDLHLEYNSTPGDKSAYRTVMEGTTTVYVGDRTQKASIKTEMFLTQIVTGFNNNVISMTTKIDSGEINVNGNRSPVPYIGQQIDTTMHKSGEVISATPLGPLDLKNVQLTFPTGTVDIGMEWSNTTPPSEQVPVSLKSTYKVVGIEKIHNMDCVKIVSTVRSEKDSTIKGLSLDVRADGTIYFAHREGKMVKNAVKSQMNLILKRVVNDKEERIITKMEMNMSMEYVE